MPTLCVSTCGDDVVESVVLNVTMVMCGSVTKEQTKTNTLMNKHHYVYGCVSVYS